MTATRNTDYLHDAHMYLQHAISVLEKASFDDGLNTVQVQGIISDLHGDLGNIERVWGRALVMKALGK